MRFIVAIDTCYLVFAGFTLSHVHDVTTIAYILTFCPVAHLVGNTLLTDSFVEHIATAVRFGVAQKVSRVHRC